MLSAAPWINEGHAELFEHTHFDSEGNIVFERPPEYALFANENAPALAAYIPAVMGMDYDAFYAGEQEERQAKYRLAWAGVYFLQGGAPELRFRPYESLRADYMDALVSTRDGVRATKAVLPEEKLKKFIEEWFAFWRKE